MTRLSIHYTTLCYQGTEHCSNSAGKNSILSSPSSFAAGAVKEIHLKSPTIQSEPAPRQY